MDGGRGAEAYQQCRVPTLGTVTFGAVLRTVQAVALLLALVALAGAGFFGTMAWMSRTPPLAARRWLRWTLYPAVIWAIAFVVLRVTA